MHTDQELFQGKTEFLLTTGKITKEIAYGYCGYSLHKGYLTKRKAIEKKCAETCCCYFRRNPFHPEYEKKKRLRELQRAKKVGKATYTYDNKTYLTSAKIKCSKS